MCTYKGSRMRCRGINTCNGLIQPLDKVTRCVPIPGNHPPEHKQYHHDAESTKKAPGCCAAPYLQTDPSTPSETLTLLHRRG